MKKTIKKVKSNKKVKREILVEAEMDAQPVNLMVSLYKVKFKVMGPVSKSLEDYQVRKIVRPDTMYAQGFSDGYDLAVQCIQDIFSTIENNKKYGQRRI